jgi:predicted GH43/DUF377 family glycosyl hydrolase
MLEKIQTPNKLNRLVIEPSYRKNSFDSHGVDCPFPFFHNGKYYLTYVGFDGVGYRTGLASSADLLTWKKEGLLLDRGPKGSVTEFNIALTGILRDNELFGPGELKKIDGRYVGTYHAYPSPGYEAGPAVIGLCFSHDLHHWQLTDPILRAEDGAAWERGGLYKSWLMEHAGTFYLFYNAKNQPGWPWLEQTGVATSKDLKTWKRFEGNPILKVGPAGDFDDLFASDPCVFRFEDKWVMFYFGNSTDGHARDGVAFSDDLFTWTKSGRILIDIGPSGSIDSRHAHKPGIIAKDGKLFHFYCAVAPNPDKRIGDVETAEFRGISLATS